MAGYKVPKKVLLVHDLPRTASGKVQKVRLRERFAGLYTTEEVKA
jgi:fatty-acyl-CoA synthase